MLIDAHFHADDLADVWPEFPGDYRRRAAFGIASVHDGAGLARTRALLADAGPWRLSFGLHPQLPIMDEADTLARLAAAGELFAVGECGFDFYGDAPGRVRDEPNLRIQSSVFEFQLELAERHGLPIILHLRRATDLLFQYAARLAKLPAVILHGWAGPPNEAEAFLARCPSAFFSFGTGLINGNKRAAASVARLPISALLVESDAPFQPPRAAPRPGAPVVRAYSSFEDLPRIEAYMAELKGVAPEALHETLVESFMNLGRR